MKLKEHPLLNPPAAETESWARASEEDVRLMGRGLKDARRRSDGAEIAAHLYVMKVLGLDERHTKDDEAAMRKSLEWMRHRKGEGLSIARLHYHMKMMNIPAEFVEKDDEATTRFIRIQRNAEDASYLSEIYFYLRVAGVVSNVPEDDLKMIKAISPLHLEQSDHQKIPLCFHLMELGIPQKITSDLQTCFKDEMNFIREKRDAYEIGRRRYMLEQLFPKKVDGVEKQIPPIKMLVRLH